MKICVVVPYDLGQEGGVKRHGFALAASLRRLGDEVDIIGPRRGIAELGPGVYGFRGVVNVHSNGSDNHLGIFTCPFAVWRLFRRRRYDVVHIHEPLVPSLNYWALWSAGRAARVGTFHAFSEHESDGVVRARRFWSAIAYRSYDRGIAVSPAAARLAETTFRKPLAIIPNGIQTALYTRGNRARRDAPIRLLFVGHWRDPRKGLPFLLEACATLPIPWALDVVGDGGGGPRSELPGVHYHQPIASETELAAMYAACDIFVAPSTGMESFGIVLLEAMAAARAIVCSDIEGYRYAVGDAARLVAPGSPAAIASAIAELAADPAARDRMGERGRQRANEFEWDRLALCVRDEYLAALESRHGAAFAGERRVPASRAAS